MPVYWIYELNDMKINFIMMWMLSETYFTLKIDLQLHQHHAIWIQIKLMKQIRIRVSNRNQRKNKHILDVKNVDKSNKIRFIRKKLTKNLKSAFIWKLIFVMVFKQVSNCSSEILHMDFSLYFDDGIFFRMHEHE